MKINVRGDYAGNRRGAYPPIGDQLDALWGLVAGLPQTEQSAGILEEIQRVKARYPKPADAGKQNRGTHGD